MNEEEQIRSIEKQIEQHEKEIGILKNKIDEYKESITVALYREMEQKTIKELNEFLWLRYWKSEFWGSITYKVARKLIPSWKSPPTLKYMPCRNCGQITNHSVYVTSWTNYKEKKQCTKAFCDNCQLHKKVIETSQVDKTNTIKFNKQSYKEYLQSEHWKATRTEARERAGNRCQMCNSTQQLEVHHNTYERIGHELPTDLICLCHKCHEKFHDILTEN